MKEAFVVAAAVAAAAVSQGTEELAPLFNGRDLSGWVNVNCAPETFRAEAGMIRSTGTPICALRTERMYENFVLELEWMHERPGGNAGVFVWADALPARGQPFLRAIEVQVLDGRETENYTSHGDVFAIHGARMTPDRPHPGGWMRSLPREKRARPAGEWNHYRITAHDGTITLAVNGKEVSGGHDISPRKGYLALESEGSPVSFRNIRLRELPSSGTLAAHDVATADEGFTSLYDGASLRGWRTTPGESGRWVPDDWILRYEPGSAAASGSLSSEAEYRDVTVMADWRYKQPLPERTASPDAIVTEHLRRLWPRGARIAIAPVVVETKQVGEWVRSYTTLRGNRLTLRLDDVVILDNIEWPDAPRAGSMALVPAGAVEFANIFVRRLGD